jgi:Flp pilus assembly protein TadG
MTAGNNIRWRTASRAPQRPRQRGLATVEFAIVGFALVLILLVAADFSRIFAVSIAVTNAARAGAQYGIQSTANFTNLAGMQQAALNDASGISGVTALASNFCECVTGTEIVCSSASCAAPRRYVRVAVTAEFESVTQFPGLPDSVTLTRSAVMRAP